MFFLQACRGYFIDLKNLRQIFEGNVNRLKCRKKTLPAVVVVAKAEDRITLYEGLCCSRGRNANFQHLQTVVGQNGPFFASEMGPSAFIPASDVVCVRTALHKSHCKTHTHMLSCRSEVRNHSMSLPSSHHHAVWLIYGGVV